jgi:hypothetical protein
MRRRVLLTITGLLVLLLVCVGPSTSTLAQDPVTETETDSGYVDNPDSSSSGAIAEFEFPYPDYVIMSVEVTVTWSDDEGSSSNPDTLSLLIEDGMGASDQDSSSGGSLSARLDQEDLGSNWTITVTCVEAGMTPLGPLGRIGTVDPGNSFDLTFTYTYVPAEVEPPEPPGPPPNIAALYEDPLFWTHVVFMIASTYMFGVTGLLAGIAVFFRRRWAEDASRWKRALATNKPFRTVAVHTWLIFLIAAVPLGMYVAGKAYGWENAWTSFPVVWNAWFWQWDNADHVSFIVLALWALPLWLNRQTLMASRPHAWLFGRIGFFRKIYDDAPEPKLTSREMALMYLLMGVFVFLVFMVQPHGN